MDIISSLPDDILCRILNLLPLKESASTSLLAKKWRNLFAFRPDLDLCYVDSFFKNPNGGKNFIRFVNRVLAVSGNFTKRKFSVKTRLSIHPSYINPWIINVLSRGILELVIDTFTGDVVKLPLDIFYCKSLVRLKLGSLFSISNPENASLPALKTLFLDVIRFSGREFEALISVCPVLEDLTVLGNPWCNEHPQIVSSPTLNRLVLNCKSSPRTRKITFDTPSLKYLEYYDYVAEEYTTINLISLVEANLKLDTEISPSEGNPRNLIKVLRNVEILSLSSTQTSKVLNYFAEVIPVLENLSRLSITTGIGSCCVFMPLLLKKAPNLETLIINGPLHYYNEYEEEEEHFESICQCLAGYSFLSMCSLKVLEIKKYRGTKGELEHLKQFMEQLPCLELVSVHVCEEAKVSSINHLLSLQTACKFQLKLFYLMH